MILIVDDDLNLRKTLSDILRAKGYTAVAASTGEAALALLEGEKPTVALIDLKLPDIDGLGLMARIRGRSPSTECIVLTGHASQASAIEAINLGAYSYVRKPYEVEQLLVTIRRAVEKQQAEVALRESEEMYRTLVKTSPDAVTVTDLEGNFTYASQRAVEMHGCENAEGLLGRNAFELIAPEDHEKAKANLRRTLKEGGVKDVEYTLLRRDGGRFIGEMNAALIRDAYGQPKAFISAVRDITERKQAQEALRDYAERLEARVAERTAELQDALQKAKEADRLKSEFIANINHELRTPMTNLALYYQMLHAQPAVKTEERLDVIGRELQRLRRLIEELLTLSRLDLGQVTFHRLPHNLNDTVQILVNDRRALAEEHGLNLIAELHKALPLAWVDEAMMVQAVSNLLTNALNYTPAGGEVYVFTKTVDDQSGKHWVLLSVQDTGPGIDADDLPHLFERFYRGKAGRETGAPGTGLGLAIVKQIIDRHHGRIEVENVAGGHGAVFTVWLPVEHEQETG